MVGALLNGALGLTGEAGEVADIIKKYVFHGHNIRLPELIKELGDVCWYIALISSALGVDLEVILRENVKKLNDRYPEGFSSEASINRSV
jgi:NTP pyrophosphatase (non-canonical NTP hydrolase)